MPQFPLRSRDKSGFLTLAGAALTSLVAVLCCAGIPAALSFAGTLGLGILVENHLLLPLMTASLGLGLWGAFRNFRRTGRRFFFWVIWPPPWPFPWA